eukprot:10464985-Ditylum_brightwellii.AAC.1
MADICSRAFRDGLYFAAHADLLTFFNKTFPLPQNSSWRMHTWPQKLSSQVISCLLGVPSTMAQLFRLPKQGRSTGGTGNSM